jgi:hypothetical protein
LHAAAPVLLAALLGAAYVILAPPSRDLASALLRTRLFSAEGFAGWNGWWYGGHPTLAYSVLFPPLAALTSPQLAGAVAATAAAAAFSCLVAGLAGGRLAALWFAAATPVDLLTGRLPFALGLAFALAATLAARRDRWAVAGLAGALAALASPVTGVLVALVGASLAGCAPATRDRRRLAGGTWLIVAPAVVLAALALAFPESGREPYAPSALLPVLAIAALLVWRLPASMRELRLGIVLYGLLCLLAFAIPSPLGANAGRLAPLLAGPLAALALHAERRPWLLAACAIPLLYLQWQAPVRDVALAAGSPAVERSYWRPLIGYLRRQGRPPFRVEIPFTSTHWEAYWVAPEIPLARGWERQRDEGDDPLFYRGDLTAARYRGWLRALAVRYVAVADVPVDPSARAELALIDRGLPYLRPVWHSEHFRVYAVRDPGAIAAGPVRLLDVGPDWLRLDARAPGQVLVRVRFSPYWKLVRGRGCVEPAGPFTRLVLRRAGPVELQIAFSLGRVGASTPRCR